MAQRINLRPRQRAATVTAKIGLLRRDMRLPALICLSTFVLAVLPLAVVADESTPPRHATESAGSAASTPTAATVHFVQPPGTPESQPADLSPLLELQQLLEQPVVVPGAPPATLTEIEPASTQQATPTTLPRSTPAAVTRIDEEMIWTTGARSINELFDITVPNAQVIRHHAQFPHLGIRGIISDRDDKYLLRVNNRIMNNRTELGAFSEHALPMLGDIHHVDFVRGPGSATFGPGAISGVVNIVTHTGLTFQGTDATVRQGFVEQFTTAELRHGFKIDEDSGVFLYYGVADYQGADQDDSPYVFGRSFLARDNTQIIAGEPVTFDLNKDHHSYRSQARHKLHAQYTNGDLDVWVRYTRSGEQVEPDRGIIAFPPIGTAPVGSSFADLRTFEVGYQQTTVFGSYTYELSDDLNVDVWLSYDTFDFDRINRTGSNFNFREDEYYTRVLGRWQPVEAHTLALGFEYSHEIFGLPSRLTNGPAFTQRLRETTKPWNTDTYSILGEHQWRINELWTTFLSGRVDKHTYSEWLFSPRAAVVFAPTDRDTFKFIAAQSVRRVGDDELRAQFLNNGTFGDAELLRGLEQRYERQQCEHLWFGLSAFYQDHAAVGFSGTAGRSLLLGEFQSWGLEPEITFRTDEVRFTMSHSYTKLVNGVLMDPTLIQGISAAGYGFGNDLANWSNHLTKLYLTRDLDECWSVSGSLRVYWDFPGAEDLTDFNNARALGPLGPSTSIGLSDPGYEKAFRANVYLNGGLERKLGCCGTMRLDLYNVLGWFDKDLNKRNYINRVSEYRSEAAAVGLSMRMDY